MSSRLNHCLPTMSRRSLLTIGGIAGCAMSLGLLARAASDAQRLVLKNLQTHEELDVEFRRDRRLAPSAMAQIEALLRDAATGERHSIDSDLIDDLFTLASVLGVPPVFEVISAYRARQSEAARPSLHALGRAMDLRLVGVDCADLASAARKLERGGVGYYRRSDFVHLDTGACRSWRG